MSDPTSVTFNETLYRGQAAYFKPNGNFFTPQLDIAKAFAKEEDGGGETFKCTPKQPLKLLVLHADETNTAFSGNKDVAGAWGDYTKAWVQAGAAPPGAAPILATTQDISPRLFQTISRFYGPKSAGAVKYDGWIVHANAGFFKSPKDDEVHPFRPEVALFDFASAIKWEKA